MKKFQLTARLQELACKKNSIVDKYHVFTPIWSFRNHETLSLSLPDRLAFHLQGQSGVGKEGATQHSFLSCG